MKMTTKIEVSRHNGGHPIVLGHFVPFSGALIVREIEAWVAEDGIDCLADRCDWHPAGEDDSEYDGSGDDVYECL